MEEGGIHSPVNPAEQVSEGAPGSLLQALQGPAAENQEFVTLITSLHPGE